MYVVGTGHLSNHANQELDAPVKFVKVVPVSESLGINIDGVQTEIFSVELQTCIITEKGIELKLVRVNNVMSYLCICSECGRGFPDKTSLKLHVKITHIGGDENVDKSTHSGTVGNMAVNISESTRKCTTEADVKQLTRKRLANTSKATDLADIGEVDKDHRDDIDAADVVSNGKSVKVKRGQTGHPETISKAKGGNGVLNKRGKAHAGNVTEAPDIESDIKSEVETGRNIDGFKSNIVVHHEYNKAKRDEREDTGDSEMDDEDSGDDVDDVVDDRDDDHLSDSDLSPKEYHSAAFQSPASGPLEDASKQKKNKKGNKNRKKATPTNKKKCQPKISLPAVCNICGKRLCSRKGFMEHMNVHNGQKPYKCEVCGEGFPRQSQLVDHSKIHTGQPLISCEVCGQHCWRPSTLRIHMRTHTGAKPHQCAICGKTFSRKTNAVVHMRTHTGEKPYPCKVCGKRFSQMNILKDHSVLHGNTTLLCAHCGKTFRQRTCLNWHVRVEHGNNPRTCTICGKVFKEISYLRKHHLSHVKPHSCLVCGKSFSKRYIMARHMRRHHGQTDTGEVSSECTSMPNTNSNSNAVILIDQLINAVRSVEDA